MRSCLESGTPVLGLTAKYHISMREIQNADTIIWDEAGISRKQIFELVNAMHHRAEVNDNRYKRFGGKELIIMGEFLQLRPVPNSFDDG